MHNSTNVLWKLNAKGLELLNKAGIVSTTPQVFAPKASQDLINSQFVQNPNEESSSHSTSQNAESFQEKSSFVKKEEVNDNVKTIINNESSQNIGAVANLLTTKESLTSPIHNIAISTLEPKTANNTDANQNLPSQNTYSDTQNTVSETTRSEHTNTNTNINDDIKLVPVTNWHLRKKKADIFIEDIASITYLEGLKKFLTSKGIKWQLFDPMVHYLPYDLLLITHASFRNEGDCAFLEDGKAQVWNFLKQHFNLS